jgi:hypothetical protein
MVPVGEFQVFNWTGVEELRELSPITYGYLPLSAARVIQ